MPIPRLPAGATPKQVAAALDKEGCAVVEGLVRVEVLDRARSELTGAAFAPSVPSAPPRVGVAAGVA